MSSYADELRATAQAMVTPGKGILAMDESNATCNKRFEKLGITACFIPPLALSNSDDA